MLNPLRSEQEAFRFLLWVAGVVAVIVASCWSSGRSEPGPRISSWPSARRARPGSCCWSASAGRRGAWSASRRRTDMVSDADRDAEAVIEEILLRPSGPTTACWPRRARSSEAASGRRWVVDPLDGTTNYLYGFPAWAVSVALEDGGAAARVGVVHDPLRDETFTAVRGAGARLNGEPIEVSGADRLDTALVATGFGYDADRRAAPGGGARRRCCPAVRDIRRAGAAALDLCMVAAGRLDGYYERGLQPWDWAAGRLIVPRGGRRR